MIASLIIAAVLSGAAAEAAPATSTQEKPICRRERVMGSNMPVKVCRTRAQMEAEQRAAERLMDQPGASGRGGGS